MEKADWDRNKSFSDTIQWTSNYVLSEFWAVGSDALFPKSSKFADAYIAKQVNVTWFDKNPIRFNEEIGLPEFHIEHVSKSYCNGSYQYALTANSFKSGTLVTECEIALIFLIISDDFSCLTGNLFLSRSIGYNLVQSYIPTGLIVMISWVSFWIDRRGISEWEISFPTCQMFLAAVPARVTLSFTTLVSLTTLVSSN